MITEQQVYDAIVSLMEERFKMAISENKKFLFRSFDAKDIFWRLDCPMDGYQKIVECMTLLANQGKLHRNGTSPLFRLPEGPTVAGFYTSPCSICPNTFLDIKKNQPSNA